MKGKLTIKQLVFILVIVAAGAFSAEMELGGRHITAVNPASTDDAAYSQTFVYENLINGFSNYSAGGCWVYDDFMLEPAGGGTGWELNEIVVWMIWTGAKASIMNIVFSEDSGESNLDTATEVWAEAVPCTNVYSGYQSWGYNIYKTTCTINTDAYPILDNGITYWLETQADVVDNCFILVGVHFNGSIVWCDNGSGVWVRADEAFVEPYIVDAFFDLYGTEVGVLESDTWSVIKALF